MKLCPDARRLLDAPNFGHLATLMADGAPKVEPVWVAREGDLTPDLLTLSPTPAQLPIAQFASSDDAFRDSGEREIEAPTMSATDLVLPTLGPNADTPFAVPSRRRPSVRAQNVSVGY